MIKPTLDPLTGKIYPAYGFSNRDEYIDIQPRKAEKILYGVKATSALNSDMHSALYAKVYSGCVSFLISEKKAKDKIMATKVGRRMTPEKRAERLMPHELTSILINEIMNLKTKPAGANNQIAVEQINKRMTKDKFSSLEMNVWRMCQAENEMIARHRNRGLSRRLVFTRTGGGRY